MKIFKKIWNWMFGKKEVESPEQYKARKIKEAFEKKHSRGGGGTKVKGGVNQVPPTTKSPRDFKREADGHFRQQQARRDSDDNFLTGAMVGSLFADSLNANTTRRDIEETKSSNYKSNYTPSSSSSYDSDSYSSSSDSGSSSSSCDSGC